MSTRRPRQNPYARLAQELRDTRHALTGAVTTYTTTLQALMDLLAIHDRVLGDCGLLRNYLTPADVVRLAEIRRLAEGP